MTGEQCRRKADAYGKLALRAKGARRQQLLNLADKWDVLAAERDAIEGTELTESVLAETQTP